MGLAPAGVPFGFGAATARVSCAAAGPTGSILSAVTSSVAQTVIVFSVLERDPAPECGHKCSVDGAGRRELAGQGPRAC